MVTRDAHSLGIEKWAETAASGNIAAPSTVGLTQSEGYPSSYKTPSGDNPEMEIIQWLWRAWSGMLVEVNEWGCGLPWDDGIAYLQYALVLGSDGDHYVAVRANTNVNPTTDSNNSDWAPLVPAGGTTFDASAIVSGVLDVAHIPNLSGNKITTGTVNAARISSAIARLASPTFTGNPRAVTQSGSDDDTSIATTAFTQDAIDRRQVVTTSDPTQTQINNLPDGGSILVRDTTAYSP